MPNTTRGYPIPTLADVPDVPADLTDLANAIDADVATVETAANGALPKATVTTKGDLLVGTGNGTIIRRGIGTDGQMLFADSTEVDGVKWKRNLTSPFETMSLVTTALTSGTYHIDGSVSSVHYFTTNPTADYAFNFRWDSTTPLNSVLGIGQSLTVTAIVTQGGTAYLPTLFFVDSTAVTIKWQGGIAPAVGNPNALDVFQFAILKTANTTFTILGSIVKFA